ncbi:MAG: hypothetical protein GX802_00765, partial [Clostridiales bacterium]|nr:hypothetical protein [Clostridiales bacterium]
MYSVKDKKQYLSSVRERIFDIFAVDYNLPYCPKCSNELQKHSNPIDCSEPNKVGTYIEMDEGWYCSKCKMYFSKDFYEEKMCNKYKIHSDYALQALEMNNFTSAVCRKCSGELVDEKVSFNVTEKKTNKVKKVSVWGRICYKCRRFYTKKFFSRKKFELPSKFKRFFIFEVFAINYPIYRCLKCKGELIDDFTLTNRKGESFDGLYCKKCKKLFSQNHPLQQEVSKNYRVKYYYYKEKRNNEYTGKLNSIMLSISYILDDVIYNAWIVTNSIEENPNENIYLNTSEFARKFVEAYIDEKYEFEFEGKDYIVGDLKKYLYEDNSLQSIIVYNHKHLFKNHSTESVTA